MSSSSLSASSSSNRMSGDFGDHSTSRNGMGSNTSCARGMNRDILHGSHADDTRNENRNQRSSCNSSDEEDSEYAARSSSSGSKNDVLGVPGATRYLSHEAAVNREKDRVMQRKFYNEGTGFPFSIDLANSVKRVLKEKIFPKIKLLSDLETQYMAPDFVGAPMDQSRNICDVLIRELELPDDLEDKIKFWITYRSLVKNQLVKYRSNCVEELKKQYFKGECDMFCWNLLVNYVII